MLILKEASKAEMQAAHEAYLLGIEEARNRIREHLRESGGPQADGRLESLRGIGAWFLKTLFAGPGAPADDRLPSWWDPEKPLAGSGAPAAAPITAQQLLLIDEVHAYVSEVLMNAIPHAEWVIYTAEKREWRYGQTVLRIAKKKYSFPLSLVYGIALHVVAEGTSVSADVLLDAALQITERSKRAVRSESA